MFAEPDEWCCMACGARVQIGMTLELSLRNPTRVIGNMGDGGTSADKPNNCMSCGTAILKKNKRCHACYSQSITGPRREVVTL